MSKPPLTRVPVSHIPIDAAHQPDGPVVGVTLDQLLGNTAWVPIARQLPRHTSIVVQVLREESYPAVRLREIGRILEAFGHRLLIDQEGEPLQEATAL